MPVLLETNRVTMSLSQMTRSFPSHPRHPTPTACPIRIIVDSFHHFPKLISPFCTRALSFGARGGRLASCSLFRDGNDTVLHARCLVFHQNACTCWDSSHRPAGTRVLHTLVVNEHVKARWQALWQGRDCQVHFWSTRGLLCSAMPCEGITS